MAERSFAEEVGKLRLGEGETFRGEGILAVTKALLESGVAYVAGYQGAPISHLMDVLADAEDILVEHGIRFENSASEATAAATLAASVNYPLRGAVTFKGPVGVNVASDALANLASGGVTGGALGHRRRGLRRRLVDHAGAQPRVRDEVADLAARPTPEPAGHRRRREGGVRAVRGEPDAGDDRAAHPRLPRPRPVHRVGEPAPAVHARPGDGHAGARPRPHHAAADELCAGAREDRAALAGGGALHRGAEAQRVHRGGGRRRERHRHRRPGRPLQHGAALARAARPGRRLRPLAGADLRHERRLPGDRERGAALRRRQARRPDRRGRPAQLHRADPGDGAPPRRLDGRCCTARTCCRAPASTRSASSATGCAPSSSATGGSHRRIARSRRQRSRRRRSPPTSTRGRRAFAPAAPSGRSSARSSWSSASSARTT